MENELLKLWKTMPPDPFIGGGVRLGDAMKAFTARDTAVKTWAWAVPNGRAIHELVKRSPIVEIGAGTAKSAS